MITRREFLKTSGAVLAGFALTSKLGYRPVFAAPAAAGLSDPALQPKFMNIVPDALAPSFKFTSKNNKFKVAVGPSLQQTGLIDPGTGTLLNTPVFGYGLPNLGYTWPGRTFEVQSGVPGHESAACGCLPVSICRNRNA